MPTNVRLIGTCRDREKIYDTMMAKLIITVVNPDELKTDEVVDELRKIIFSTKAELEKLALAASRG